MSSSRSRWLAFAFVAFLALVSFGCGGRKQEKAPSPPPPEPAPVSDLQSQDKLIHEKNARASVADIEDLIASSEYDAAARLAASGVTQFADTAVAAEFPKLKTKAEGAAAEAAQKAAQRKAAEPVKGQPEPPKRFADARAAGLAAMNAKDYPAAIAAFQSALKEEDDPATRELLETSMAMSGPPRLAVAEFEVLGDVRFPDAGRIASDLLQSQFDTTRFRLVDRTLLTTLLADQGLDIAQIVGAPLALRDARIGDIRYLVVGTIVQMDTLNVSARLVDVGTGDVVQTAEAVAEDQNGLRAALAEVAAILQMTDEEKAGYLDLRQGQLSEARIEDERRLAQERFQARQHERDALRAVADIRSILSRGDLRSALENADWAAREFADTPASREIDELRAVIETEIRDARENERRMNHLAFLRFRERGRAALAGHDIEGAIGAYAEALKYEDDPALRQQIEWLRLPGLAVVDFEVSGDIGLSDPAQTLAGYLLEAMSRDGRRFRAVERRYLSDELRRLGLTPGNVVRNPADVLLRRIRGVRYLVTGSARPGSIHLEAELYDLAERRRIQTASVTARRLRDLHQALEDLSRMLQMSDEKRRITSDELRYKDWMGRGDESAAAGRWQDASDAYNEAYKIGRDRRALEAKNNADKRLTGIDAYAKALAAGRAAQEAREWQKALDAFDQAAGINRTVPGKTEVGQAKAKLYEAVMAAGKDAERSNASDKWQKAVEIYQMAVKISDTPEARAGITRATEAISKREPPPPPVPRGPTPYEQALEAGRKAQAAGEWQKALDAYAQAAQLNRSMEAQAEVGQIRAGLYQAVMAAGKDAEASSAADKWQSALEAYQMAAKITNTPEARNGIARVRANIPQDATGYERAMEAARTAQAAGEWQKALDAYIQAGQLNRTIAGQAEISQARMSLYESVMDAGRQTEAADAADKWQKALKIYQTAAKINNTVEARAGISRATAAVSKREPPPPPVPNEPTPYEQALETGRKAQAAGEWQKALNAYVQAGLLNRTPAAQAETSQARKGLYDAVMAAGKEAEASDAADKWQKALAIYQMALKISNTVEARAGITRATEAISKREPSPPPTPPEPTPYEQALEAGRKAQAAGEWQQALDAYVQAGQLNRSPIALRQIGQARKSLYDAVLAAGRKAEASDDPEMWKKALEAYEMAAKVVNTPEVKTSIARIKEKLKVK